jgi:hypothetical protein
MKVKDINVYENWKANNKDGYGACVFRYTERWADMMEQEMQNGVKVKDIADKLSHQADTEGITGFMYGVAVNILSQCWEYGDELRRWHNKEYDYEGDGVVNPAVLTINKSDI